MAELDMEDFFSTSTLLNPFAPIHVKPKCGGYAVIPRFSLHT